MQESYLISGLAIYTEQGIFPQAAIQISQGRIAQIFQQPPAHFSGKNWEFPAKYHLLPGRIDMHIHGARGADVMDATPAALNQIRLALAAEGVTGFLATTVTESVESIDRALQNVRRYQQTAQIPGAEILGVHLEGPFISPQHVGAHRAELILPPDIALFDHWQACAGGMIKSVTLAPELPRAIELIHHLRQQGVIASIGHTNADFATTELAITAGAHHATHLFNAMRGFHHREPGCLGAILQDDRIRAELIADGYHCHPGALNLAIQAKGLDKLVLITDAMRAKCCDFHGEFDLGGQMVTVQEGAARLKTGVLAGSVLTMTQAVKNMLNFTGCSLRDLVQLTSVNPAQALDIYAQTGSIAVGKAADLIVLDEHLEVILTLSKGQIIYSGGNLC